MIIDYDFIRRWFFRAQPGSALVYHKGNLSYDRRNWRTLEPRIPLNNVAKTMWEWQRAGKVSLFQRRNGETTFDYIAIKR